MGYTHYWKTKRAFTEEEWNKFTDGAKKIIKATKVTICNGNGRGKPTINSEEVLFNGIGDKAYESCYFTKAKQDFEFCKTARQPYDEVVVACLLLLESILGKDCKTQSDGGKSDEEWARGTELYNAAIKE